MSSSSSSRRQWLRHGAIDAPNALDMTEDGAAMEELMYALQFRGTVERSGPDGNVLRTTSRAPGCTLISRMGDDGLSASVHAESGEEASLESELIFTGASTFQELGVVEFGKEGHRIRFSTVGSGYAERETGDRGQRGGAMCRIDGGDGQFAGVRGMVVSLFSIDDADRITVHQLGIIRQTEPSDESAVRHGPVMHQGIDQGQLDTVRTGPDRREEAHRCIDAIS